MNKENKIDIHILAFSFVIITSSLLFDDARIFLGAFSGAILACLNWFGFKYLAKRFSISGIKLSLAIFLAVKTLVIMAMISCVIWLMPINRIAFVTGLSSLVLGIFSFAATSTFALGQTIIEEKK